MTNSLKSDSLRQSVCEVTVNMLETALIVNHLKPKLSDCRSYRIYGVRCHPA